MCADVFVYCACTNMCKVVVVAGYKYRCECVRERLRLWTRERVRIGVFGSFECVLFCLARERTANGWHTECCKVV